MDMLQLPVKEEARMPDYVRRMRLDDADLVLEIDREAFPTEWPAPNFKRELDNRLAHYVVACRAESISGETAQPDPPAKGLTGLTSWVRKLFGGDASPDRSPPPVDNEVITGFAGFWVMADEAHITSIATRESHRRQGIGELMLQSVIHLAAGMKARIVTLEVRVSNTSAQRLYTKYGFSQVGLRKAYYTDNREDAMVMSTDSINSAAFRAQVRELRNSYHERWGTDRHRLVS